MLDRLRIERSFSDTQEESGEEEAGEVLGNTSESGNDSPESHG